jgi:phosphomannomutase
VTLNFIDGIRIVFENGDVSHLRPSGNAPEFRNYATADTKERAEEIVKVGLDKILPKMREDIG